MELIWKRVQQAAKESMDPDCFQRWIAPLRLIERRDRAMVLSCPNAFFREWVEQHYRCKLAQAFRKATGQDVDLEFRTEATAEGRAERNEVRQTRFAQVSSSPLWDSGLNGNYTFERFVVGPSNEFAYSASLEVARSPKTRYNPLLLLADVGLGKSHLSCAVGNHIMVNAPQQRVYYITAEGFVNEMVQALKGKKLDLFKEKFRRQCDVLLLDGVHFLSGKAGTQTELAHTLDALQNSNKRIVLTSSLLPQAIPEMEPSLRSRISCGLVVDIKPPDLITRCRILHQKARQEGVELPEPVVEYLAHKVTENVRQLESVLIHLLAKASLLHRPIDLELAEEVIRDLFHELSLPRKPTVQEIVECVCRYFRIEKESLVSRSRKKAVYYPRQVAMYLCRQHTDATLTAIGKAFRRNHASVIHSLAVMQRRCRVDSTARNQVAFLSEQLLRSR
jgi:chromosomal replication initiator protein